MFRQIPNLGKELDKNHVGKELACGPSLPFPERVLRKRSHHLCPDRPSWTRELVASSTASYAKNVWLCPEHLHSQSLLKVNSVPRTTGSLGYFGIFFWGFYRSDISSPQDMPRMCSNFVFDTSRDQTLDLSSSRCPDQKSWRALEDESFRSSLASWFLTWGTRDSSADAEGSEGAKPLVSQGWRMVDRKTPNGFRIANGLSHPTYKYIKTWKITVLNVRIIRETANISNLRHPTSLLHQQTLANLGANGMSKTNCTSASGDFKPSQTCFGWWESYQIIIPTHYAWKTHDLWNWNHPPGIGCYWFPSSHWSPTAGHHRHSPIKSASHRPVWPSQQKLEKPQRNPVEHLRE